jgi:hypothetical protein
MRSQFLEQVGGGDIRAQSQERQHHERRFRRFGAGPEQSPDGGGRDIPGDEQDQAQDQDRGHVFPALVPGAGRDQEDFEDREMSQEVGGIGLPMCEERREICHLGRAEPRPGATLPPGFNVHEEGMVPDGRDRDPGRVEAGPPVEAPARFTGNVAPCQRVAGETAFIGLLTLGAHHQPRHLAMARGEAMPGHGH